MPIASNKTRVLMTLDRNLKFALEGMAKSQNRSMNNLIVTILKNYAESRK